MRKFDNFVYDAAGVADFLKWAKETDTESSGKLFETTVVPYGYAVSIGKMVSQYEDYDRYTASSKSVIREEITGLIKRINLWIDRFNEPDVTVRLITGKNAGKVEKVKKSEAEMMVEFEMAEVI